MASQKFPLYITDLLGSGLYSDLTIKCKEREWKVHRAIVCTQSKPFAAAMNGNFEEAKTGIINMDEQDPDTVDHMIKFFYYGDYDVEKCQGTKVVRFEPFVAIELGSTTNQLNSFENICFQKAYQKWSQEELRLADYDRSKSVDGEESEAAKALVSHAYVYVLAEERDIPGLKTLAKQKYAAALTEEWNSASFSTSLRVIWEGTPESDRDLWNVAIRMAGNKAKELLNRGEFVQLWKENGSIALEVFKSFLASNASKPVVVEKIVEKIIPANYYKADGCPNRGLAHAAFVGAGRHTNYWCTSCREAFD